MIAVLSITFPIYAILALGYILVRRGFFSHGDLGVLAKFAINIALPPLLFSAVASNPIRQVLNPAYIFVYAGASLLVLVIAALWFTLRGLEKSRVGVAVLGSSVPNAGFIGYPIMLIAHSAVASQVLALNVLIESLLIIPLCLVLMELESGDRKAPILTVIGRIFSGLVRQPMVIAIVAGFVVSLLGFDLPEFVTRLARILANALAPLALFFVGGSLAGLAFRGNRIFAAEIVVARLLLHPALVVAMLWVLPLTGIGFLEPELRVAVILMAAMPMIGIYPVLAAGKGHGGMASISMFGATVGSFFTVSALLMILG